MSIVTDERRITEICNQYTYQTAHKALSDRFEPEIDKVKRRLIQIDTEIAEIEVCKCWGASLTALNEERKFVALRLDQLETGGLVG